jgi:hypothetical protein
MNPILEAAVAKGFMTTDQAKELKTARKAKPTTEVAKGLVITKQEPPKAGGALVAELASFALGVGIVSVFGPAGLIIAALGVAASSKPEPPRRRRRRG